MADNNKIVYAALARTTSDREMIKQAFLDWRAKFAHAELDVFKFVDHIDAFLDLSIPEKKVLMMSMHSAATKSPDTLKDVPPFVLNSGTPASSETPADNSEEANVPVEVKSPCLVLAEIYFNSISAGLQREGNKNFVELVEILNDEKLPGASKKLTRALRSLDGTNVSLPKVMSEDECKSFCHETYMLALDIVGPTLADTLSYKAVNSMLQAPEASRYDPKDLI